MSHPIPRALQGDDEAKRRLLGRRGGMEDDVESYAKRSLAQFAKKSASAVVDNGDPASDKAKAAALTDEDVVKVVSKALEARMRSTASSHDALLDEKNSLSAVLQFSYTWRKAPSKAEVKALKESASKAGKTYVPDSVSAAPMPVRFDVETLNKAFGGKINFSKEQYLLSAYIESSHNSSPYPLNFTLKGVQGKALERVHSNDGSAATATLHPQTTWTSEHEVYRMSNVDAANLYAYGNVDLRDEISALTRPANTSTYFVPASRFIGKIISANIDEIQKTDPVDYVAKADMYMVEENVVADILSKFHEQVLADLKTTDFSAIEGVLTRADRPESSTQEFADATDAPGLGSKAAAEAAHKAVQSAVVNVRLHAIDPAKLRTTE